MEEGKREGESLLSLSQSTKVNGRDEIGRDDSIEKREGIDTLEGDIEMKRWNGHSLSLHSITDG